MAEYIHGAFYSAVARDRNHPPRVAFSRLTVRQYRNTVADLIGSFRGSSPAVDSRRGLHGEYFLSRDFDRGSGLVFERVDSQVDFSFGLWDSIPDQALWNAAVGNRLTTPEQVRRQAERMVDDRRTRSKLRDFLMAWLRIDARAGTDDEIYLNGRLSALYGAALPADADFRRVRLDGGRRGGVLSHPYMMSVLSYAQGSSPIHRGVFLARNVLGNVLKPPQEAVAPLGFALEEFDAVGAFRTIETSGGLQKPIDASGSYLPREGPEVSFRGARELAEFVANSPDAQEAFVQGLFHALVKQPVRAWGTGTLERLRGSFASQGFDIRRLLVDIMVTVASPRNDLATTTPFKEPPCVEP